MTNCFIVFVGFWIICNALPKEYDADIFHPRVYLSKQLSDDKGSEYDAKFWNERAAEELNRRKKYASEKKAKNVIFFLGDGMSVPTLTASRILLSERNNEKLSRAKPLSFEDFIFSGLSRTYCVDLWVADSACSATAYLGGVKGNVGTIGLTAAVKRGDAKASNDTTNHVHSLAYDAIKAGKAAGFVTNTRVTHATPAGTYAHIADRDWENDAAMEADNVNSTLYDDIAEQLILREPGNRFNVIMGGGRYNFLPKNSIKSGQGKRLDGVNLIKKWLDDKKERKVGNYRFVSTKHELLLLNEVPSYLLGLFASSHMNDTYKKVRDEPTLEEMTETAIKILQNAGGEKGFFLFVEGGRIDIAHHDNQAQVALDETIELSKAVAKAMNMTSEEDTLIVVTADHAHTMSVSGYDLGKNSILGFGGQGTDKWDYTTLSYANGPGYDPRGNLSSVNTTAINYMFPSGVPLKSETHGGDDVAVFARGPNAQLFSGSYDQSYIPHAIRYTSGVNMNISSYICIICSTLIFFKQVLPHFIK